MTYVELRNAISEISIDVWHRAKSADDATEEIGDLIYGYVEARVQWSLEAQTPYGYHIVSEVNGNGVAFCPAAHPEAITEFMQAYPATIIRAVALIPK